MENRGPGSTGLPPNVAAALSYVVGFVTGIIFYLIEKEDKFVRFHAMQSIILSAGVIAVLIALSIISAIFGFIPVIGGILGALFSLLYWVINVGAFVLFVFCIYKAFTGARFKIPYVGDLAEKYV